MDNEKAELLRELEMPVDQVLQKIADVDRQRLAPPHNPSLWTRFVAWFRFTLSPE